MKRRKTILSIVPVLLLYLFSSWNTKDEFREILKKSDFYRGGQVQGVSWNLKVENIEQGKLKNELSLLVEASSPGEQQFVLVSFLEPPKFSGQKLLIRNNSMWFSKMELRSPLPISNRQRLSGSAANADVASANYFNDYSIASTEEGAVNGISCWVFNLEAKNNLVPYSKVKYWVSKNKNYGLQAEFYGRSDKLIKVANFEYNNKVEYNEIMHDYISKIIIYDRINTEDKTILSLSAVKFQSFNNSKFQTNRLKD